jgi:hypothetical protein
MTYAPTVHQLQVDTVFQYCPVGLVANERQAKVIAHMFKEGNVGFKGGYSTENYIFIAETPEPLQPAILKSSWKKVHSPKPVISGIQDIS